jgi:2'-hydroxyisoflavone reductase
VFISSVSVYPDLDKTRGLDENAPVGKLEDETIEEITSESYGPLKALCEQAAEMAFPGRALNIRPGLIVGPNDPTDRFTYWPVRVARGGEVLAPGGPDWETQVIDVRDLGEWTIRLVEQKATGVYNATGYDTPLTFGQLLETCKAVSGSDAKFVWMDNKWLLEAGAQPWMELPLWLGEDDMAVSIAKAVEAGLIFRPIADTVRDTLAWEATRPQDREWRAGMKREKEEELLKRWESRH